MAEILVGYKPSFIRQFKHLDPQLQQEIREKIELFKDSDNHERLKVHKLRGSLAQYCSFSVNYHILIIFEQVTAQEVVLLAVGDHDLYR